MIRNFGALLLTLPLAAALALPAATALAQYAQPYYGSAPPPGYQIDPHNPDLAVRRPQREAQQQDQYGSPNRVLPYPQQNEAPLPDPTFSAPFNAPPPRHQRDSQRPTGNVNDNVNVMRPPAVVEPAPSAAPPPVPPFETAVLPPEDQPEQGPPQELPENLQRQMVDFRTREPAGTIIIDTPHTYLYLILGHGKAIRYGIGVGREGFTWSGTERISKMKEWPDWFPPAEMIERQPYLPRMMAGGPGNPLGARALYLGHTLYRIHGTNQPSTIGKTVSSGCIRLLNKDIEDLYSRVQVGSRVVVLPGKSPSPDEMARSGNAQSGGQPAPAHRPMPAAPRESGTAISGAPLPPIR
jgi:lipoprotein-anchoring transpeptidase ErfK/SrfK